jgi:predicted nucleic acid-binding protein
MLVLADSGILLRLVNRTDPLHSVVRAAVRIVRGRGDTIVSAFQNVAEFWNVCTRPASARGGLGLSVAETHKRLRLIERFVRIIRDTPAAYPLWKQLVVTNAVVGVQAHDARLIALMLVHGATHILTLNVADFGRYQGITAFSPQSVAIP